MRWYFLAVASVAVGTALGAWADDKLPVPAAAEQESARARIRTLFKTEYNHPTISSMLALSDKLVAGAVEEKDKPSVRYVMLTEAMALATKAGDFSRSVRAAREVDRDYNDPGLKDTLASSFADLIGSKDKIDSYRNVTAAELSREGDPLALGRLWLDIAKLGHTDARLAAVRRARHWLGEALASQALKGLTLAEAERLHRDATGELDKADARLGRFTLYEGKWVVKYDNKYTHEYAVSSDGSLAFDRAVAPDGAAFVKKEEQKGRLVRRGGVVLATFANGKVVERFTLVGDKLMVDRFDPASRYPNNPVNKGEGETEK